MKKIILLASIFILGLEASAQKKPQLHTPAEVLIILTDSKVNYSLSQLDSVLIPANQSSNLNFNDLYRKTTQDGFSTVEYKVSKEVAEITEKAEEAFQKNNIDEARKYYLEALGLDSTYYLLMTYIGQTYGFQKNWDEAIEWDKKAIKMNYIDYMAHWFLADAYDGAGRKEEAKKEILIAHILNRNNPRIITAMKDILAENKLTMSEWVFSPQYSVKKKESGAVEIKYGGAWLPYALVKAIWAYEPGYRQSMGYEDENTFRESEEKEGLIGILLSTDEKTKLLPERKALEKATKDTKNNMMQEFVFYEILLPKHPEAAYQLPENFIEHISDYILKVRCEKSN